MEVRNIKNRNILGIIILVFLISLIIIGAKQLVPKSKAQEITSVNINYISEENSDEIDKNATVNQDTNSILLIDFLTEGTENWQHTDIIEGDITYEATFAGWKLVSINDTTITEEYIYPDNDYIYFNDEPFASFSDTITNLKFEALWGKTVYVRDPYNFVDIQNVYGYNAENSTGDILTAKINWDTSVIYSSDDNSGATKDEPVSTIEKAYELLQNSYGGKICIVNHITLEAEEAGQSYSETFANKSYKRVFELGNNLNISGLVTISGKDLGSGTEIENKAGTNGTYANSYMYMKNTRGAGTYNGKTYASITMQIRLYTNTVFEDFAFVSYRENYNSNGARQTTDSIIYNTANKRFVIEETFEGYKRSTSQSYLGLETGNFSHVKVQGDVNGNTVNFSALSIGLGGCTHIYGSTYSYTKDGKTYTVNENDNVYLTIRGGNSWYSSTGITATSGGININNIHINIDNVDSTSVYGTNGGKILSANEITIDTNNVKATTVTSTYNNSITAKKINIILRGTQTKTITTVYSGGYNTAATGAINELNTELNIKVDGAKITNFYGGGNQVATLVLGEINIDIQDGKITNLFGGGLGGYVGSNDTKTNINLNINGGTINSIYGGGSGGFVALYVSNGPIDFSSYNQDGQYFYNNSNQYYATTKATYSNSSTRYNDATFRVKEYSVKSGNTVLNTYTSIYSMIIYPNGTDAALSNYYKSNSEYTISDALVNGDITINLNDGANVSSDVYGGGKNGAVTGNITINVADGAEIGGNIYGGGEGLQSTIIGTISGIDFVWTNSQDDKVVNISKFEETCVGTDTVFSLAPEAGNYTTKFLIGQEMKEAFLQSDNYIYVYSETISKLGLIDGDTSINVEGGTIDNIYGGSNGSVASVSGNTDILIKNGIINNIYGGGNAGEVLNTNIVINGGTINNSVYGGGNVAQVKENTKIHISSGTFTDIFGGGNQSYVQGNTTLDIGDTTNAGITVTGLVYGGGRGYDANGDGDASDYTTVYGSSDVNIQGTNTSLENYGSIKLGAVVGDVMVTFKDYWTGNATSKYKTMNGIDRATTVTFNNSYVLLENKDSEGKLEGIKAIENLVIKSGSGLKISADGEITGNFEGGGELYLDSEVCLTVGGNITGVTQLVLNPMLFSDTNINLIKGGIENPYLKVAGESQATETESPAIEIVSGEKRYDILAKKQQDENGITYSYYYIAEDINITDFVQITSSSIAERVYNSTITNNEKVKISNNQSFTTNLNLHYELLADDANPDKYTAINRELVLKIDADTLATIPKGTEILMIKNGNYYYYILEGDLTKVPLTKFKDYENNIFEETTNIRTAEGVSSETNETTQSISYRYNEEYRFIIDFANTETAIKAGTYYAMLNVNDSNVWLNEEQTESANNIEISDLTYEYTYTLDKEAYEGNGIININGTLKINGSNNTIQDLAVVAKLLDENGNQINIPDGSKLYNGQEYSLAQNGIAQIKVIAENMKLSLDMTNILSENKLVDGNYKLLLELRLLENEILKSNIQKTIEIPIEIQNNAENTDEYGIKVQIKETVENVQIIKKADNETRTINLQYTGTLEEPKVKIKLLEKTAPFEYINTENANNITVSVTELVTLSASQEITLNFGKNLNTGTYRVVFELYDKFENKLTESLVKFIVIE